MKLNGLQQKLMKTLHTKSVMESQELLLTDQMCVMRLDQKQLKNFMMLFMMLVKM